MKHNGRELVQVGIGGHGVRWRKGWIAELDAALGRYIDTHGLRSESEIVNRERTRKRNAGRIAARKARQ